MFRLSVTSVSIFAVLIITSQSFSSDEELNNYTAEELSLYRSSKIRHFENDKFEITTKTENGITLGCVGRTIDGFDDITQFYIEDDNGRREATGFAMKVAKYKSLEGGVAEQKINFRWWPPACILNALHGVDSVDSNHRQRSDPHSGHHYDIDQEDLVCNCPQGPPGATGAKGTDGRPGQPGTDGVDGRNGTNGIDGLKGPPGVPGRNGTTGADGADGAVGEQGEPGKNGVAGAPGIPGTPGTAGPDGPDGRPGTPGKPGKNGRDGLPGNNGPKGDYGYPGLPGIPGNNGVNGVPGTPGPNGHSGIPGTPGTPGANGLPGQNGICSTSSCGFADEGSPPA